MYYKHSPEALKDYSVFAKEYAAFHEEFAKTYVKKTWKEAREMIQDVKITEIKNEIVYDGTCRFGTVIIPFFYNCKIKKVTSIGLGQGNAEDAGFYNENNIPYLISQAIAWAIENDKHVMNLNQI